jgi:uncharacterized surface protein with fasciclin (FAS1) repeats
LDASEGLGQKGWRQAVGARREGVNAGITTADVYQSNGVIHVIDAVVMAK